MSYFACFMIGCTIGFLLHAFMVAAKDDDKNRDE